MNRLLLLIFFMTCSFLSSPAHGGDNTTESIYSNAREMVTWICRQFTCDAQKVGLPRIHFLNDGDLARKAATLRPTPLFIPGEGIYLPEFFPLTAWNNAKLLHELVHHAQKETGRNLTGTACEQFVQDENEAYYITSLSTYALVTLRVFPILACNVSGLPVMVRLMSGTASN